MPCWLIFYAVLTLAAASDANAAAIARCAAMPLFSHYFDVFSRFRHFRLSFAIISLADRHFDYFRLMPASEISIGFRYDAVFDTHAIAAIY